MRSRIPERLLLEERGAKCGVNVSWTGATSSCPLTPNIRYNVHRGTTPDFAPSAGNRIATCVAAPSS